MATTQPSPLPLAGCTAIVTGASRGIGRGIASHISSLGADVIIGYSSNPSQAEALASELTTSRGIPVKADVSDPEAVQSLFDTAESAFGRPVHILVASAGVLDAKYPTLADTSVEDWDKTFAVNTRGAFLCCREAAKRVVRGGGGRIVVITTSLVGSLSPQYAAYTASKAAVEAMVKTLAKELKGTAITANCVAPGAVATDMFYSGKTEERVKLAIEICPMGRIGETGDIAPVVGFLCTDPAGWVNGQVIRANGGYV
ncbi:hypothetical protein LUZ63_018281 [Rhynchospora breviuscula]|uniref:NADPH-dependent aldehyde reductase-like protein, chloroplastic n=1 Tax=Rhynchospora breviuscula TaxID=2022672 RepID=A0A9Q0HHC2_9POAL|nr:hypothetical protein LUZ63_018281 [Rhynchospora breviuscula]